jgi:hypothetical protein
MLGIGEGLSDPPIICFKSALFSKMVLDTPASDMHHWHFLMCLLTPEHLTFALLLFSLLPSGFSSLYLISRRLGLVP